MNTNKILIGLIVVLIALSFPAQAQNDGWSSALEVPGAQTLTEGTADFTECFISFSHCGGPWYKCEDTEGFYPKKGAQNVTGEHVWAQVHKDFDFTITNSSPGRLYMIFESHEGVTIGTTKKGKDGKWQVVSASGLVRSAIYYGTELRYIAEPLRYKINPSGSIEFGPSQNIPVHVGPDQWLKPGQFRVTLVAGRPYNYNTGLCTYVPSSGNVKVLFIPDVPEVTDSDKDGVPDDKDKCSDTPAGVAVDDKGCPVALDSDGDGVPDDIDECLGTPAGVAVDDKGCPLCVADFWCSPRTGVAPMKVECFDYSYESPVSWTWDFGDGTTSTE